MSDLTDMTSYERRLQGAISDPSTEALWRMYSKAKASFAAL